MNRNNTVKWHILVLAAVFLLTGVGLVCPEDGSDVGGKVLYFTSGYQKPAQAFTTQYFPDRLRYPETRITAWIPVPESLGSEDWTVALPDGGYVTQADTQSVLSCADNHTGFVSSNKKVVHLLI